MTSNTGPLGSCIAASVLALGCVGTAASQTVLIDFDDRAASSCVFSSAERIATQYESSGVVFTSASPSTAGAIIEKVCSGFEAVTGHSPPNIVGYVPGLTEPPVGIELAAPADSISVMATNYRAVDTITLTAYDAIEAVVGSDVIETLGMVGPLQRLEVVGSGIVRAELTTNDGQIAFDDLTVVFSVATGPAVYESNDPQLVVAPANLVGNGPSPYDLTPSSEALLFYQVDDGGGSPARIWLVDVAPDLRIHF